MIIVPVDLTGEQKTVMAYFSVRQVLLVLPALAVTFGMLLKLNIPFLSFGSILLIRILLFLIINAITFSLAFIKLPSRDQYLSHVVLFKIQFWLSQKRYTNIQM
ncbi:PrgI family protein [Lysinibacillus fusiformis]|uniref:PrgI family protein n=1 Tax=Lysinibacillus fusiformis TaxID=28031 RepID=UPI0005036716|nr:PrgI family protein [Lysinibacillus fusiformis]KGA83725.1 hypothetical protein KQ41_06710 [Lysinibacillus fusiformis]UXJ71408.1 PrgI family protein [Lysinibacillus fusiformis]